MNILIVDIETTNFLGRKGKIIEIGIVSLSLATGETKIVFDEFIKEDGITKEEIENSWIFKNSDIKVDDIMNGRPLKEVKGNIQAIFDYFKLGITAFNNPFDFGFLKDRGFSFPKELDCPMKLSTDIVKIPKGSGYKWPTAEEAYNFFFPITENKYVEKHRGADDALHEAKVVYELYKMGVFKVATRGKKFIELGLEIRKLTGPESWSVLMSEIEKDPDLTKDELRELREDMDKQYMKVSR